MYASFHSLSDIYDFSPPLSRFVKLFAELSSTVEISSVVAIVYEILSFLSLSVVSDFSVFIFSLFSVVVIAVESYNCSISFFASATLFSIILQPVILTTMLIDNTAKQQFSSVFLIWPSSFLVVAFIHFLAVQLFSYDIIYFRPTFTSVPSAIVIIL